MHLTQLPATILKNRRYILIALLVAVISAWLAYSIIFLAPSNRAFSYDTSNCVAKTVFLPRLHSLETSKDTTATYAGTTKVANFPVISRSVCLSPASAPTANSTFSVSIKPLGNSLIKHTSRFQTGSLPKLSAAAHSLLKSPISTADDLSFSLNKTDNTFSYQLVSGATAAPCSQHASSIRCATAPLGLSQGKSYDLSLVRLFRGNRVATMLSSTVQTVPPLNITESSIKPGATIYDAADSITLTFDKPLASYKGITLTRGGQPVKFTAAKDGAKLIVKFAEPLARQSTFDLTVGGATAVDKGFLASAYKQSFTTSGGPKYITKNIGNYDVPYGAVIRLTFDVGLKPDSIASHIRLKGDGGQIPATVTSSGSTVTISPGRNFGRCETFTIEVLDGIASQYGFTGGSATHITSRSTCRSVFSIGTSAEGRAITAYKFGNGSSAILYVGATHGNETSSKTILDSWVTYLESVASTIPANRSIIVIPSINPDGVASGSRTNSHGVDLNRNFPSNNWKANVTMPGGQLVTNGGGTSALSEPESAALAAYTQLINPRLVLTFHSKGSIVTANESGDSMALATVYGKKTGYWAVAESLVGSAFNYDTTGAYENWLHDKVGIPTLLIELPGHTGNYFNSNRDAMWYMVTH